MERTEDVAIDKKQSALRKRLTALLFWILAIAIESAIVFSLLQTDPPNYYIATLLGVGQAALAVSGYLLWISACSLYTPAKRHRVSFFFQYKVGLYLAVIAFFPLVIAVLFDSKMNKPSRYLASSLAVAVVVLLMFYGFGVDLSRLSGASVNLDEQRNTVVSLTGSDEVHWTANGTRMHLYHDCPHIAWSDATDIRTGTVDQAHADRRLTEICKSCYRRANTENPAAAEGLRLESP